MTVRIDRLEEDVAVLVLEGRAFEIPRQLVPDDAREGDTLFIEISRLRGATDAARARTTDKRNRLSRDDDGGDFSL